MNMQKYVLYSNIYYVEVFIIYSNILKYFKIQISDGFQISVIRIYISSNYDAKITA